MTRQLSGGLTKSIRLYRQANLCCTHTPCSNRSHRTFGTRSYRVRCITLAVAAWSFALVVSMVHPESVLAQNPPPNVQYTSKAVDLGLRGNLTVNPSTLALEIEIPLGGYAGRAGLNVPIAISY